MTLAWGDRDATARADLVARIDALAAHVDRLAPGDLTQTLQTIRRIAARHGIGPALPVVHAINTAVARGERGTLVRDGLAILRDAVRCASAAPGASETYAAACSVRLNG